MPVLLTGWEPNDVSGVYLFDGTALTLHPAGAGDDDQGLAEWVGVPSGAGAGLEGDAGPLDPGGFRRLEEGIDADLAGKPVRRAGGGGLRAAAFDVHPALDATGSRGVWWYPIAG